MHAVAAVALPFHNRRHAAGLLADALGHCRGHKPLVLAIPRGAVAMGQVLAERLGGELDVVLVRKLGAPWNPELAVGAVDETGWVYRAPFAEEAGADADYLRHEAKRQRAEIARRRRLYTPAREPLDPRGREVIVVDDGLATGATMIAALHAIRAREPARLVCAVPVASCEALAEVEKLADEVVCLAVPDYFSGVGRFYLDFRQIDDAEVVAALARSAPRDSPAAG